MKNKSVPLPPTPASHISATMQDAKFNRLLELRQEQAHQVIRTTINLSELHVVCHYSPFPDLKTFHHILSTRWMGRLDVFLSSLGLEQSNRDPERWNKSHKAKEIVRRLRPEPPVPAIWDYKWNPSITESTTHTSHITDEINSHFSEAFRDVPFTEIVKAACGYPSNVITSLLQGVTTTRSELCSLIQDFDALKSKFELVEQYLCAEHPIAYWIVSTSLCDYEYPPDPSDALTLLIFPIQDLVADTRLALIPMLKRLAWLSV
ncbi:hypothetical protein BJ875DRAFT_116591 [Amylocarpus encephaloides]|uniref:Uncharacterized protein n=1 Tax=Amylocarpus encephaloides TaxID=45428 RepID=A0A9P7YE24_9HELO|nr:hypothetical protein BJ875DRAFT_116591 [Amylocarpus encephaloides]